MGGVDRSNEHVLYGNEYKRNKIKKRVFLLYQDGLELRRIYKTLDDRNEIHEETLALLVEHFQTERKTKELQQKQSN